MGGAGPEREGTYAVSASDVRKDQKAKEKAPLFLHGIEPQGHKWSCPLCPCWGAGGEVSGPLWTVLSPQEKALMCPLSLSAAFPGKEDMAKAQVTLRTLLSVQVEVREGPSDIPGCGCRVHPGKVGAPGHCSEGTVPRGHAGEVQEPGLPGVPGFQA